VALAIESTRFGHVEIDPDTVIEFPDGLIGLGGTRYTLLTSDPDSPFLWLHCIDDPSLSLPVTDPHRFFANYQVELTDEDGMRLGELEGIVGEEDGYTAESDAAILLRVSRVVSDRVLDRIVRLNLRSFAKSSAPDGRRAAVGA